MKRKLVVGVIVLTVTIIISGCATVSDLNPFKKTEQVSEQVYRHSAAPEKKSEEEIITEINSLINQAVENINAGKWDNAITAGEDANKLLPVLVKALPVGESVYSINSNKEKLYETLVEAYDFKNHLQGLSQTEKEKYVRTARDHYAINTADPFKKLALAKVLIETGGYAEGLKLAGEVNNSVQGNKDVTDTYAWGLYMNNRKPEAYEIYKNFYPQSETLIQVYHAAAVIEEKDKSLGLKLYKACQKAGNNLMVKEENQNNQSAESFINRIITDSQKAIDRLLVGGWGVDSQYRTDQPDNIVNSIVSL